MSDPVNRGDPDSFQSSAPAGVRTTGRPSVDATEIILVRHGEAICNVEGVIGGVLGCTGLTDRGVGQVEALAERLSRTGELGGVDALYSSVLPRARQTAAILAPALDRWRDGPALGIQTDCDICELHPGEADGLTWAQYGAAFPAIDWDKQPTQQLAPGGESWLEFVGRASTAVRAIALRHPGERVVLACHAGVVESAILRFLPISKDVVRLKLHTTHASMTRFDLMDGECHLRRYNDATPTFVPQLPQQA